MKLKIIFSKSFFFFFFLCAIGHCYSPVHGYHAGMMVGQRVPFQKLKKKLSYQFQRLRRQVISNMIAMQMVNFYELFAQMLDRLSLTCKMT